MKVSHLTTFLLLLVFLYLVLYNVLLFQQSAKHTTHLSDCGVPAYFDTTTTTTMIITELVLGLMLGVSRSITPAHDTMRRGEWAKKSFSGRTLRGKTLGIVGFGSVGQEASATNYCWLRFSLRCVLLFS